MNICGHIIEEDQVVGIGPLMSSGSADPQLYNSKKLSFKIYLKEFATEIESDLFDLGESEFLSDENEKIAREKYKDFKVEYEKIFQIISRKIDLDRIADYTGPR